MLVFLFPDRDFPPKKAPCTFTDPDEKRERERERKKKRRSGGIKKKTKKTSAAVDSTSSYSLGQTLRLLFHTDSSVKATLLFT